jgi:hypothetical protein
MLFSPAKGAYRRSIALVSGKFVRRRFALYSPGEPGY